MKGKKVFAVLGITSILICSLSGCSLFQTMSSLTAVSYTHLDVYKRQSRGISCIMADLITAGI